MNPFDLQFWIICTLFSFVFFIGGRWLRNVVINAVSKSVAQVVSDQWAQMFLKLDSYKETVDGHGASIAELKKQCGELEKKAKVNRKDIDDILEKVRNLK
jgi:hypothetical protein